MGCRFDAMLLDVSFDKVDERWSEGVCLAYSYASPLGELFDRGGKEGSHRLERTLLEDEGWVDIFFDGYLVSEFDQLLEEDWVG